MYALVNLAMHIAELFGVLLIAAVVVGEIDSMRKGE